MHASVINRGSDVLTGGPPFGLRCLVECWLRRELNILRPGTRLKQSWNQLGELETICNVRAQ